MRTDYQSLVLMLDDIEQRESKLTDWEREFVDSISQRVGSGQGLTEKQDECLVRIWERVTDI